jgi:hypothetical protein
VRDAQRSDGAGEGGGQPTSLCLQLRQHVGIGNAHSATSLVSE